jgi:hypothetical protein
LFQFVNLGDFSGDNFPDDVVYPSDYDGSDIFVPMEKIKPPPHQIFEESDGETQSGG